LSSLSIVAEKPDLITFLFNCGSIDSYSPEVPVMKNFLFDSYY
jgi:hypothetical protein